MIGPGKYDDLATILRKNTNAKGVVLVVIHGERGSGMSSQVEDRYKSLVPDILRLAADEMERELAEQTSTRSPTGDQSNVQSNPSH